MRVRTYVYVRMYSRGDTKLRTYLYMQEWVQTPEYYCPEGFEMAECPAAFGSDVPLDALTGNVGQRGHPFCFSYSSIHFHLPEQAQIFFV